MSGLQNVISQFDIQGEAKNITPFGSGHINDTFHVSNRKLDCPDYLVQRINHNVFKDVPALMQNTNRVTKCISKMNDYSPKLIRTKNGFLFFRDEENSYWRTFTFINGTKSYDLCETVEQAYKGAKAFGAFLKHLSDCPAEKISEVIPDFHNCIHRLDQLWKSTENGISERINHVAKELKYVRSVGNEMCKLEEMRQKGKIPLRITHNDTKLNNVLFDQNDNAVAVIDLDTVMPGLIPYDFGDGVRTITSTVLEDEADLSKVDVDLLKFEAFATGYLEETHDILTPVEMEFLPTSGALLAFIMGIRFLTDYITGDTYYKTGFPEHNFHRATCQLELSRKLLRRNEDLRNILRKT